MRIKIGTAALLILISILIWTPLPSLAAVYYVAPTGSDANSGTLADPWATIAYGADQLQPGDTLIVKGGQYTLQDFGVDMITPPSGRSDAWITIKGEEGNRPAIVGQNNLYAAFELSGTSYLRLENLEIRSDGTNPFRGGISAWDPAEHIVLLDLHIHHLDEMGINMKDVQDLRIANCCIEYCGFGAVGGPGGDQGGWRDVVIEDSSLSYSGHYYQGTPGPSPYDRPDGFGIEPSQGPVEIRDTIAEHNRGDGLDSKASGTTIRRCVVAHNSCDGIKLWSGGSRVENSLVYDTGDGDTSPTPWSGLVVHTTEPNSIFEIVNTAIVDHPERHAYPMYVQYDDQEVPLCLTMKNCIVSHGQGAAYFGPSVTLTLDHCLFYRPEGDPVVEAGNAQYSAAEIGAGSLGLGNLARDPMFQAYGSAEPEGYRLMQESPAVDAGNCEGAPADDIEGHPRPMGAGCDMGPFEQGSVDNQPPSKPSTPSGAALGYTGATYGYATSATDPDGDQVKYTFDWGDGSSIDTDFIKSGESASESHSWSSAGTYQVKAIAADLNDATSDWSDPLAVTIKQNKQPNIPSKPAGSAKGYPGTSYSYSTSATDPDKDRVMYTFDWGDGTASKTAYVKSGTKASASHVWSSPGTYQVKATATDVKGASSVPSGALAATISANNPPNTPRVPSGPILGKIKNYYTYTVSTVDPDKDKVKYIFDWGYGTTSTTLFVKSGANTGKSHMWSKAGTYQVRAMAVDTKGGASGWSGALEVNILNGKSP